MAVSVNKKVVGGNDPQILTSLAERPTAAAYGKGELLIVNPNYRISCTSDGVSWDSHGSSDSITDRPSASVLGKGSWQVGSSTEYSDGVEYSNSGASYIVEGVYEVAFKPLGLNASNNFGAAGINWYMKLTAPCDFDEVQVVIYHHDPSTTTVFKAVVAATEDPTQASDDQRWQPMIGGVKHNELDGLNGYGWRSVKWDGGAATHTQGVAATSFTDFGGVARTIPAIALSDWIPCPSVPSNDGTNNRYALLFLNHLGTTSFAFADATANNLPNAINHGAIMQVAWGSSASGAQIDDPTNNPVVGAQAVDRVPTIGVRFRTRKPAISAITISDSIAANFYVDANHNQFASIGYRMAAILTAQGIPCTHVNNGWPGNPMDAFSKAGIEAINALKPNLVMMNCWSPNGPSTYTTTDLMRQALRLQRSEIQKVIAAARVIGAKVLLSSGIPSSNMITAVDALRLEHIEILKTQADFIDENTPLSNGATPQRIAAEYQYDTVHPNGLAIELLANNRAEKVKKMFRAITSKYSV